MEYVDDKGYVQNYKDIVAPGEKIPIFLLVYIVLFGTSALIGSLGNLLVS